MEVDDLDLNKRDTEKDIEAISNMDTPVESEPVPEVSDQPSILDLTRGGDDMLEIVPEEEEVDVDLIEGKSLDDILKTTVKKDSDWRHRTIRSSDELPFGEEEAPPSPKRLKIWMVFPVVVLLAAAGAYFLFFSHDSDTSDLAPAKVRVDKLRIPSRADERQLRSFYSMARRLLSEKKYKDAERVLNQLRERGWREWLVAGALGGCALARSDKKAADKFFEDAVSKAPSDVLSGDFKKDYARFAGYRAEALAESGDWRGVVKLLSPLEKTLTASEEKVWALLAMGYYKSSDLDKALKAFDHVRYNVLTKEQLEAYASLLERQGRSRDAFDAYLVLLRAFDRNDVLDKIEKLSPDTDSLVMVLLEIAARSKGKTNGGSVIVRVAKTLFRLNRGSEAFGLLRSLDTGRLTPKGASDFLLMLPYFKNDRILTLKCHDVVAMRCSKNVKAQKALLRELENRGEMDFARSFFDEELRRHPNSAVANYMSALTRKSRGAKVELIKKAIDLSPSFYAALLDYGRILQDKGDWASAAKKLNRCVSLQPSAIEPRRLLAMVEMKLQKDASPLRAYEKFLRGVLGASDEEVVREMVLLAHYLPNPSEEEKWLAKADGIPVLKEFAIVERLRSKLAGGALRDADFKGKDLAGEVRRLYMIYLFGEGRDRDLLLLPTKPEDFPEFWKVYVGMRMGLSSWRRNAELIIKRRPDNLLESVCAKLWLGRISPEEAEKFLDALPYEEKPLLCAMIANRLRADKKWTLVGSMYAKALKYDNPNLYVKAIKRMMER